MLKGKRVVLRPVKKFDATLFLKWFNDPEIMRNLGLHLPVTAAEEEKWIESLATTRKQTDVILVIEAGKKRIPIGCVSFNKISSENQNAELSIAIGEKRYRGRGYGPEAIRLLMGYGFDQLNLHRVYTGAYAFNEASLRALAKCGFRREGPQRQAVFADGRFWDNVLFGILRTERRKLSPVCANIPD